MKPKNVQRILDAITEVGPMTRSQIADYLDMDVDKFGSTLTQMTRQLPYKPQRLYICRWDKGHDGQREYPRAVYAIGARPNVIKPKPYSRAELTRRYYAKARKPVSSVFDLGLGVKARIKRTKQRRSQEQRLLTGDRPMQPCS